MMRLLVLLMLVLSCPAISYGEGDCSKERVGETFVVVEPSQAFLSYSISGGASGTKKDGTFREGETFQVESVDVAGGSYVIFLGGNTATGLLSCSDFRSAEKKQRIIQKKEFDDAGRVVGKSIWIKEYPYHKVYDRFPDGRPLDFKRPEEAVISESRFGEDYLGLEKTFVYTLTLMSGGKAYISKKNLEKSLVSGVILDNMTVIAKLKADLAAEKAAADALALAEKEKTEREKATKLAGYRAQTLADLKQVGITQGKTLWLRLPKDGIPGLTAVTVVDVRPEIDAYSKWITLVVSHDGNHLAELRYYVTADSIAEDFYNENVGKGWPKRVKNAIADGKVFLGMTKTQVVASWGQPQKINRTVGRWGVHEQWVYGDAYIYFENDKVTSWQD